MKEITGKVSILVRSSVDPISMIFLTPTIKHSSTSESLIAGGIFVLVFGSLLLSIPIISYMNAKKERTFAERTQMYRI